MGDAITITISGDVKVTYTSDHGLVIKQWENQINLSQRQVYDLIEFYTGGRTHRESDWGGESK
jgi:predicted transcriptional regulator